MRRLSDAGQKIRADGRSPVLFGGNRIDHIKNRVVAGNARKWVRQAETGQGVRGGLYSSDQERFKNGVGWCNHRRLLEPIGNILPVEFEMAYYRQLEGLVKAA